MRDAPSLAEVSRVMNQTTRADAAQLVREYEAECPGDALQGATFEGKRLVLANDAYLLRVVPDSGRVVDRLETFPASGGLAFDGHYLWQRSRRSLQQLDGRTGFVVQSVTPELSDVTGLECLRGDLLVLHSGGRRLTRLHVEAHGLSKEAVVVGEHATDESLRGLSWVGGELWSSTDGELVRIDPTTADALERLVLPGSVEVCDIAVDALGRFWCIDGKSRKVRVFARPASAEEDGPSRSRTQGPASSLVTDISATQPSAGVGPIESPASVAAMSFTRILVPIDFSQASRRALATALLLQERLRSEVHLFHLMEQGADSDFLAGAGALIGYGDLPENARGELVRFVDHLFPGRTAGVVVHARVGTDLVAAINGLARDIGATLVLLAGKPRQTLFRTRIERIVRDVERAVMVLPSVTA
jgi:nucleotide-binding universal stress UspA family protein